MGKLIIGWKVVAVLIAGMLLLIFGASAFYFVSRIFSSNPGPLGIPNWVIGAIIFSVFLYLYKKKKRQEDLMDAVIRRGG